MPLTERQKKTLEKIGAKLAAKREKLKADEAHVLEVIGGFDASRRAIDREFSDTVGDARDLLHPRMDSARKRLFELATDYNQAAEAFAEEFGIWGLDVSVSELEKALSDEDFATEIAAWMDASEEHELLEFDAKEARKEVHTAFRGDEKNLDRDLRLATKDPDKFLLEEVDDPEDFLGAEDFEEWDDELALEEED